MIVTYYIIITSYTYPFFCSQQTVGVIVRLEKEAFKVLTQHGKEVNVQQHAIQQRKTRAVALDYRQVGHMIVM